MGCGGADGVTRGGSGQENPTPSRKAAAKNACLQLKIWRHVRSWEWAPDPPLVPSQDAQVLSVGGPFSCQLCQMKRWLNLQKICALFSWNEAPPGGCVGRDRD